MKTKGFTLVETMVALLLITLSFGSWMMLLANVDFGENTLKLQYSYLIDAEFSQIIKDESYFNETYFSKGIAFSRSVSFMENEDYINMELIAYRDGELIGKRKELIYRPWAYSK